MSVKAADYDHPAISYGAERPHYAALERAINGYYHDLLTPLNKLRFKVFGLLPRVPNEKQEEDDEPFAVTLAQLRAVDGAIGVFLTELAGVDRSPTGFTSEKGVGVIQQRNLFAYAVGICRAQDQMGGEGDVTADRSSPGVQRMLTDAFQRLSENGRLRLEGIRDDVHEVLANGMQAGLSPVEVGRQLTRMFDDYGDYNFQRLARTEVAFSAIAGQVDQYRELAVEMVEILVGADACEICQPYDGDQQPIDGDLPPYHPQCCCDIAPIPPDESEEPDGSED